MVRALNETRATGLGLHPGEHDGLTHPLLMKFPLRMLANLTDPTGGNAMDGIINGLSKVAPKA